MNINIIKATPKDKKWRKEIYNFQIRLYKKNPYFIPNLKMDTLGGLGQRGILDYRNPFHKKAKVVYFIAQINKKTVGTIAAINHHVYNEFHKEKTGFFGFFEVIEDSNVSNLLLDKASEWLKDQGLTSVMGPFSFDTNGLTGLLINSFDSKPFFQTTYNFPYYQKFLEDYGMTKAKDVFSFLLPVTLKDKDEETKRQDRLTKLMSRIYAANPSIEIKEFNSKNYKAQFQDIKTIINTAWADNWGYVPLIDEEFDALGESLKIIANPKLILIAYINKKPVAFIGVLPDIYSITGKHKWIPEIFKLIYSIIKIKLNRLKRCRLMLFGILFEHRKIGLDALLFMQLFQSAQKAGLKESELSWVLENNTAIINASKKLSAPHTKTWRIFKKDL